MYSGKSYVLYNGTGITHRLYIEELRIAWNEADAAELRAYLEKHYLLCPEQGIFSQSNRAVAYTR